MRKRGEHKGKNKKAKKTAKKPSSKKLKAAEKIIQKEERLVKKEVKFLLSPEEFHVVTFVSSLIILAFLFNSISLVFYAVLTIAVLAVAHFMKQHHRPHDVLTILSTFFLPIVLTIVVFRDLLAWLLLIVYTLSAISTIIIYYYHKKVHSLLKIMWQVTYSKIIAITLAILLACILPYLVLPGFVSIFELIFLYILPIAFVLFFASKFFYIYFFDRKHIRSDILRSLRYTITYTLVFIVILMCLYSLFAVSFYNTRAGRYNENIDIALLGVANIEKTAYDLPEEVSQLMVTKDMVAIASDLREEISLEKSIADETTISFADIVDDSYFATVGDNAFNMVRFVVLQSEITSIKQAVVERYNTMQSTNEEELKIYIEQTRLEVEEEFISYSQDPDVTEVLVNINNPETTYSYFEDNGIFYWFAEETALTSIYHSESIVGRQVSLVLRHTELFRQMTQLVVNIIVFGNNEAGSSSAVEYIYANRDADLLPVSSAIRYSIIKDSLDAKEQRAKAANRITFKVE
jgi:hypothetical protein